MRKLLGATAIAVVLVVALLVLSSISSRVNEALSSVNPFRTAETVDRTGPSVLKSLNDLSEFRAASGYYETVVSLEEGNLSLVPNFLDGEKILYVGKGTVDAVVEFSDLDKDRVVASADRTSVRINLPAPRLGKPVLDLEASEVFDDDRSLFQDSGLERQAQLKAIDQMATAANGEADLIGRAKDNTTDMLTGLLGALGYDDVTVTYDKNPT